MCHRMHEIKGQRAGVGFRYLGGPGDPAQVVELDAKPLPAELSRWPQVSILWILLWLPVAFNDCSLYQ